MPSHEMMSLSKHDIIPTQLQVTSQTAILLQKCAYLLKYLSIVLFLYMILYPILILELYRDFKNMTTSLYSLPISCYYIWLPSQYLNQCREVVELKFPSLSSVSQVP